MFRKYSAATLPQHENATCVLLLGCAAQTALLHWNDHISYVTEMFQRHVPSAGQLCVATCLRHVLVIILPYSTGTGLLHELVMCQPCSILILRQQGLVIKKIFWGHGFIFKLFNNCANKPLPPPCMPREPVRSVQKEVFSYTGCQTSDDHGRRRPMCVLNWLCHHGNIGNQWTFD